MTGKVVQVLKVSATMLIAVCEDGSMWRGSMVLQNDVMDRISWSVMYTPAAKK